MPNLDSGADDIEIQEWRFEDDALSSDFPLQVCYKLAKVAALVGK
jgi:hypothetical protein